MKVFLFIGLFLLANFCLSQTDTTIENVYYSHVSFYDNGSIFELGNFSSENSEIKNGSWVIYSENGAILEKGSFTDGKKSGTWDERSSDKNSMWHGNYKKGKREGNWFHDNRIVRYKRGKIKSERIIHPIRE